MKKLTLFSFLFLFLISTQAQITITQADLEAQIAVGETVTSYVDSLTKSVDVGGTGQGTWDFSGLEYQYELDATSIDPSSAPTSFSGATHVTYSNPTFAGTTSETWVYLTIGNGAYANIGTYTTATLAGFASTTTITIDPPETLYQLPIDYNTSWSESGTRSINVEIGAFPGQQYDVTFTNNVSVDAYGTITMPNGTSEEVLRIVTESEVTSNAGGIPTTSTYVDYTFLAKSGTFLTVSVADAGSASGGTVQAEDITWAYGSGGGTSDVKRLDKLANDFSLSQNYPNPFNPTTNIEYSIPQQAHVSLKVYDVLGKEVASLVNEELSAGVYNVDFDGSNLSSGIYFYTLTADNFVATKKLMLVK